MKKTFRKHKKRTVGLVILAGCIVLLSIPVIHKVIENRKAYVQEVSQLDQLEGMDADITYGTISDSASQDISLETGEAVQEVYVKAGQKVSAGDPLFSYDTASLDLNLQSLQLEAEQAQIQLDQEQRKLSQLENTPALSPEEVQALNSQLNSLQKKAEEAQNALQAYLDERQEELLQKALNAPEKEREQTRKSFEDFRNGIYTEEEQGQIDALQKEADAAQQAFAQAQSSDGEGLMTVDEKESSLRSQKTAVQRAENALKAAQRSVETAQTKLEEATVHAPMSGIIAALNDAEEAVSQKKPFMTISSFSKAAVKGGLTEDQIGRIKAGDRILVNSFESGLSSEASVLTISEVPDTSGKYSGNGNPNSSVYVYTAVLDQGEGFKAEESVQVSPVKSEEDHEITLSRAYVRTDEAGSYALIEDEQGKLKRVDLVIESSCYDPETVIVKDVLQETDLIAFPYGKKAYVGNRTKHEQGLNLLGI